LFKIINKAEMKRKFWLLPLWLVPGILIVLSSCSEEFLIREPQGVGAGSMMNSPQGVEAVLTGAYAYLR
jgi:hypothetical protein